MIINLYIQASDQERKRWWASWVRTYSPEFDRCVSLYHISCSTVVIPCPSCTISTKISPLYARVYVNDCDLFDVVILGAKKWLDQLRNDSTHPIGDLCSRSDDRGHGGATTRRPSPATRTWWRWWFLGCPEGGGKCPVTAAGMCVQTARMKNVRSPAGLWHVSYVLIRRRISSTTATVPCSRRPTRLSLSRRSMSNAHHSYPPCQPPVADRELNIGPSSSVQP